MTITCRFTPRQSGPVAEASIEFHEDCGPLAGFEINSFAIWRKKDGPGYTVTSPSRQYIDKTGAKKYQNYVNLRRDPAIPDSQKWALANWIENEYRKHIGEREEF